jgi:hypothetical protein
MIAYAKPLNPVYPKDPVTTPIESSQPVPSDQPGSPLISNLTPDQSFQLSFAKPFSRLDGFCTWRFSR